MPSIEVIFPVCHWLELLLQRQNHAECDLLLSTKPACLLCERLNLILSDLSVCFHLRLSQDLIVDQTIEKVSFCAPDRNYDKAFSYICRDGTTRRWMCHCFMALKDSVRRQLTFQLLFRDFLFIESRSQTSGLAFVTLASETPVNLLADMSFLKK